MYNTGSHLKNFAFQYQDFMVIWDKFELYLVQIYHHNQIHAKNAPSNGTILDEFSEQPQHQSITKVLYLMPISIFW